MGVAPVSRAGARVSPAAAARAVVRALEGGRAVAVVQAADGSRGGARLLVWDDGETAGSLGDATLDAAAGSLGAELLRAGGVGTRSVESARGVVELFGEAHSRPAALVVVGAGHIALPLARLGVLLGFRVVVLDDREEFATGTRFPDAAEVRRVDFADPFREVAIGAGDAVVLVTRAHRYDYDCLRVLLGLDPPPSYIGMVGSRRRVRAALGALLAEGVTRDRLASVRAPIGVDIGAETPEEIAVSIAAELVAARRGVEAGGSLRDAERVVERLLADPGG